MWLANHRDGKLYFCPTFPLWLLWLTQETTVALPGTQLVMGTAFMVALLDSLPTIFSLLFLARKLHLEL
jgi:hypothetical protein